MSMLDQADPVSGEVYEGISDKVRGPWKSDYFAFGFDTGTESMVQQQFVEECDINNIVRKYMDTGVAPNDGRPPIYDDFSAIPDYREALDIVMRADDAFSAMPSSLRARFDNDPARLIEFVQDPANADEALKLGLRAPPAPSDVDRVIAAVEAAGASSRESAVVPPSSGGK